ncbi:hypothetical protein A1O7_07694 [Cladophialophora yegresii CBS 114405]|uniref:DUF1014 domain-containing protein n=1 Tax=Cladophialophora yegresii CBS 114405 TaxID=1182544 RepID=W9VNU2_9EURO|nr:uncharacterized protein A1O7_07694 [Cladophialophora yegresii CBS 114405]EXJ57347.1 hypothetical protein A1O7_07694 [Cladophialophora yegresii CBS 114405]
MPHNPFIFSPTQFIRIFVIVNITTYITAKAYLNAQSAATQPHSATENTAFQKPVPSSSPTTMAPKNKGENTKKAAGNARKAEAAASKQAQADRATEERESEKWNQGAKDSSKKQAAAAKAAEQAAKKAERDAMLAEEEKNQPSKPKGAGKKTAEKKNVGRPLDLGQLDDGGPSSAEGKMKAISATGIDNALDALSLATGSANDMKLDRHPERRYAAAYKAYEERRLPEVKTENPGLRRNQQIELIRKEFERSEENPFNQQGNVRYDASKEELADARRQHREGIEKRLGEK